jgi:hypothetical protein
MSKPKRKSLVEALRAVCDNADSDCPSEYRTDHFRQALYDALCLLEDEDGEPRHTYANPDSLEYGGDGDDD